MPAPKTTVDLLKRHLEEGRGFGHGESYRAFLQLKRWNASPVSVQTYAPIPPFRRYMHFLSRSEWLLALLLSWIGCHVREQFPMWPWRHFSPVYGLDPDRDSHRPCSSGTLALCRDAGIDHGLFVGTDIPYIWTLDLAATLAWLPAREVSVALVSVKPLHSETYTGDIDPISRGPEKLEIERRYAKELGIPYFTADRTLYPGALLGQLELYSSAATLCDARVLKARERLLDEQGNDLAAYPPLEWRGRLVSDYELSIGEGQQVMHNIIWHQLVDVDVTRELQMEDVARPGGRAIIAQLRRTLQDGQVCAL